MNPSKFVTHDDTHDWRAFADKMFMLEDSDPVYLALARSKLAYSHKLRFVLAWCAFYDAGIAASASEYTGKAFYNYLREVYPTARRASERRHFRGKAGLNALASWEKRYPNPADMIEACFAPTYMGVRKNMQNMTLMGDYFYWKLADVQDTVFGEPVDFTGCERYMPKVPKQGAEIIGGLLRKGQALDEVMAEIVAHISKMRSALAPHRPLLLQEAETVCCVFKQHVHGKYKYGFRTAKAVARISLSKTVTAKALLEGVLEGGIWTHSHIADVAAHL
jgi:hypothetical protein